jgi:hypothetical protein
VTGPIVCNFLHTRGILRASRLLGIWQATQVSGRQLVILRHRVGLSARFCMWVSAQSVFFVLLAVMAASYGNTHHHGGPSGSKAFYAMLLGLTGLGYGSFLAIIPICLADAYGHENFGWAFPLEAPPFRPVFTHTFPAAFPQVLHFLHGLWDFVFLCHHSHGGCHLTLRL